MKNILKKLALLAIPVLLWLAFFIAFEPNNYFGLKASATSSQPVARVRAYQQDPGTNLILGDSRLAHFDMGLVDSLSGQSWQNLAFGGASLKETLDLADYLLDSGASYVVVLNADDTIAGIVTKTSVARSVADNLWGDSK